MSSFRTYRLYRDRQKSATGTPCPILVDNNTDVITHFNETEPSIFLKVLKSELNIPLKGLKRTGLVVFTILTPIRNSKPQAWCEKIVKQEK